METGLNGVQYTLSGCNLLTDTGVNDNVRIHSHTDTEDDTCDTRKGQGDIKSIQCYQHQCSVHQKSDTCNQTRKTIYQNHEQDYDDQADGACDQAGVDGLLTELCAYHLGTELFQLQRKGTDTDGGSKLLSFALACHTTDDCAAVCDGLVDSRELMTSPS